MDYAKKLQTSTLRNDIDKRPLTQIRQAILTGKTVNGSPAFLEGTTLSNAVIKASVNDPLVVTSAKGWLTNGAEYDLKQALVVDKSLPALTPNANNYCFLDTVAGTTGFTNIAPLYGAKFDNTKHCLINFDSDASCKYGNATQIIGGGTVSGGKFVGNGTNSGLKVTSITTLGNGAWSIEGKFKFNANNVRYELFRGNASLNNFILRRENTNRILLYLSSNGSTWDIANGTGAGIGTKSNYDTTTEYRIKLSFDGIDKYTVSVDGTNDITITSSARIVNITELLIGHESTSNYLAGTIDDIRVTVGDTRQDTNFVPDVHWFDTTIQKMKYGSPSNYAEKDVVFLGNIVTGASTVSSINCHPIGLSQANNIIGARAKKSANQSIAHNVATPLTFDHTEYDTHKMFDVGDNTKLTCKMAGVYLVKSYLYMQEYTDTNARGLYLMKNGASIETFFIPSISATAMMLQVFALVNLKVGDYIFAQVLQRSGVSLLAYSSSHLEAVRIGGLN